MAGFLFVSAWLAVASTPSAPTIGSAIAVLEGDVGNLQPKIDFLTREYLKPEIYDAKRSFDKRLTDGEILHLLGDHVRAGILLFDIVSDSDNQNNPLYSEALYYLAESNFQIRNFYGARRYFSELISRSDKKFLFEAFSRLIEIADELQDYSGIEEKVAELRTAGAGVLRPDVAYFYGKSLARRGQSDAAVAQLATIPPEHKFYFRARYVMGVEAVRHNQLEKALPLFKEVAAAPKPLGAGQPEIDQSHLHDLANLAVARVYGELNKGTEALDAYQEIARQSPFFEQMLYEVAWNYIQRSNLAQTDGERALYLKKALQALDLQLLSPGDNSLTSDAEVLKGNVLLKLGRYTDATIAFNDVTGRYQPVKTSLDKLIGEKTDPLTYFNEVVAKSHSGYKASAYLPAMAVSWATGEKELSRALGLADDIDTSRTAVDEVRKIGEKLTAVISSQRSIEFYPALLDGDTRGLELQNAVVDDYGRTLDLMHNVLTPQMTAEERTSLEEKKQTRVAAKRPYTVVPHTKAEIDAHKKHVVDNLQSREQEVFRQRLDLDGIRAQLVALNKWAADNQVPSDQVAELNEEIRHETDVLDEAEAQSKKLEEDIGREKTMAGLGVDQAGQGDKLRDTYLQAVNQELEQMLVMSGRLQGGAADQFGRLELTRGKLANADTALTDFRSQLGKIVAKKTAAFGALIELEESQLTGYDQELAAFSTDAKYLVGSVAYSSFENVRQQFYDLVLKADVGKIDVAWREKEVETDQINGLVKEQKNALKALEDHFQDLLTEGGSP